MRFFSNWVRRTAMEKSMAQRWQLKDYVFAALMTVGLAVTAKVTQPFASAIPLPGATTIAWAPFAAIFLTLGMARLRRSGAVALMAGVLALILGIISWTISAFLVAALLAAELVGLVSGGFAGKTTRLLANMAFFAATCLSGWFIGVTFLRGTPVGDLAAQWLTQPWVLAPAALVSALAGAVGWWLGEQIVFQLQRAGKLDVAR
jgi:energy-coupling factor transport system substrate-specific component